MKLKEKDFDHMIKREDFLTTKINTASKVDTKEIFKNSTQQEVNATLNENTLFEVDYRKMLNPLCSTCSEKDICLEFFKSKQA